MFIVDVESTCCALILGLVVLLMIEYLFLDAFVKCQRIHEHALLLMGLYMI